MNTPVADFLEVYAERDLLRLHMPGHKGKEAAERWDITEVAGADVLSHAEGILAQSEENAAGLFGTAASFYSTEGSTLAIRAMLALTAAWAEKEGKPRRVLALRNAHQSFLTSAALLDLELAWYQSSEADLFTCPLKPEELAAALEREAVAAVYVTSPDYPGTLLDIAALSRVCREKGVLLLCDNAHGAYLRFLPRDCHPISLGAHLCCDSAHKTLPVLTGGGYLHVSKHAPDFFARQARRFLSLFASTSPSYLILRSLDRCNRYLAEGYRERLASYLPGIEALKESIKDRGFALAGAEPLKVTVRAGSTGVSGEKMARRLRAGGVEPEYGDPDQVILMFTPENGPRAPERVKALFAGIPRSEHPLPPRPPLPGPGRFLLTPREALLAPSVSVPVERALGRVLAAPGVTCPPAIPIALCGERLEASHLALFSYYGISQVEVVQ